MEKVPAKDEGENSWGRGWIAILHKIVKVSLPEKLAFEATEEGGL